MEKRKLGKSGIEISPMDLGCWAIGGNIFMQGMPLGWSTVDDNELLKALQRGIEMGVNFIDTADMCEAKNLASINRGPLAMGLLTGKFSANSTVPEDDCRSILHFMQDKYCNYFSERKPVKELLGKLDAIREILKSNGRTLAQGALAWLWARSENTIPIPGFKTVKQVEENAGAMQFGPLTGEQTKEIDLILHKEQDKIVTIQKPIR